MAGVPYRDGIAAAVAVRYGEELSPSFHYGDASRSALMPSILDKAFKGEL